MTADYLNRVREMSRRHPTSRGLQYIMDRTSSNVAASVSTFPDWNLTTFLLLARSRSIAELAPRGMEPMAAHDSAN